MLGIVYYFEDSSKNVLSGTFDAAELWRETGKVFGVDTVIMIDCTTSDFGQRYKFMDGDMTFHRCASLDESLNIYPESEVILVETPLKCPLADTSEPVNLKDLAHPEGDTIYVFGPDSSGITNANRGQWIYFDLDYSIKGSTWSFVAAGIVLYDRMVKKE